MVQILQPVLAIMLATSLLIPRAMLPCCCSASSRATRVVAMPELGRCGSCCGSPATPAATKAPAHDENGNPHDRSAPANCPSPCCTKHVSPPTPILSTVEPLIEPLLIAAERSPHSATLDSLFRPPRF